MRVLVIDDERPIRRLLEIALGAKGWEVFAAPGGFEGLQAAGACKPDVVLLDLNLPDMGGLEVLRRLREWSGVPVVALSVRDSEADIVALLQAGADDYVVKPFYTNELVARIEAVHRRRAPDRAPVIESGPLRIDRERREVAVAGRPVRLTPTEYAVLELLARNAGKLVTRDRILREIWGPAGESEDGNLRVHVAAIRRKIEADPASPRLLVNEPGVGYRLELLPPEGP